MTKPGYEIVAEPEAGLLRLTFIGYWDEDTARVFEIELHQALEQLASGPFQPGQYRYLSDFTHSAVQSPAMVERFQYFAEGPGALACKIAVIAPSTLMRMQTKRMGQSKQFKFFESEAEASAWLSE